MSLKGRTSPVFKQICDVALSRPLESPRVLKPSLPHWFLISPNCLMPGTSKGFWRKKLSPLAFSPVDLSHHPLPSNKEGHSLDASSTHQDGNLKLHPLRSLWKSGSTLFLVLKEVCFFYVNSQPHPAAYHIDTIFPMRDTCQLPEARDLHPSCSRLRFPNLEQSQTQSGSSAYTCRRNGCCNKVPPL